MTIREAVDTAAGILDGAGRDVCRLGAEVLLLHILK